MQQETTGFRLASITLIENSKRGQRIRHRKIRTVTRGIELKKVGDIVDGVVNYAVTVNDRQLTASLKGSLDTGKGNINFTVVDERVSSYLKKKRFKVVGYNITAQLTNVTPKEPAQ